MNLNSSATASHPLPAAALRTPARVLMVLAACSLLSGCFTLYTKQAQWHLPPHWGDHTVTARLDVGLFTWTAKILVDEHEIMAGDSYLWSSTINMTGNFAGIPISALCDKDEHLCDVSIANLRAKRIQFEP